MNRTTTHLLLIVAVGLFAYIVFFERHTPSTTQLAERTARFLPGLDPAKVHTIEWQRGTNPVVRLERTPGAWQFRRPFLYPAQSGAVDRFLERLADLRQRGRLSANEVLAQTNGLAAFGLQPPAATLALHRDAQRLEWRVGARTLLGNQVYLECVGHDGLYIVDGEWLSSLPDSPNAWRDPALAPLGGLTFNRLELRPLTNGFEVVRNAGNRSWLMTKPILTRANSAKIEFLLQQLSLAQVTRFVADGPQAVLELYGLQPPAHELAVGQGTNDLLVLQIGRSPTNAPDQVYIRRLSHSNVVLAPRATLEPWLDRFGFFDRRMLVFDPDQVGRIEVRADEAFALERRGSNQWQLVEPVNAAADALLVLELFAHLTELEFSEFERDVTTEFAPYGLDPPRRQFVLRSALTNSPAGPTNLLLAQLDLGNVVNLEFFARRTPENAVMRLLDPGRLPRAAFELRDRRLWDFTTNQIASVTVEQLGATRQLLRTGPLQWTHAPGSQGVLTPFTVEEAAYRLGRLRAERWVARGQEQLASFGFATIDHRVTVALNRPESPHTLTVRFGRRSPAGGVYATVSIEGEPGPVIFECPPFIADLVLREFTAFPPPRGGAP
ncbi:MAG: DUF4340 domain-containing protein [Verrucomicrobia bacterium]|nr:DUF4340 domain-containing protein [Verrucomicrobiota bacterium]